MSPTLCLTMIVKNESKVIKRCFDSIHKYIDYWAIHDTGSTDGTPDIIQSYFKEKNIPGELHHTPWQNFGYNRTKAVQSAKGKADFSILMDADFEAVIKDPNFKSTMVNRTAGYLIQYEGGLDYRQNLLICNDLEWKYHGVTHEYIHAEGSRLVKFDGFTFLHHTDGGSRSDKFTRDIQLLSDDLKINPGNGRSWFYLAQSYKDLRRYKEAIPCYEKRAEMGGWPEEHYFAQYMIGYCKMRDGQDFWTWMPDLLKAHTINPGRLEALTELIRYCRLNKMHRLGYQLGMLAYNNSYPSGQVLFINKHMHEVQFWDELSVCAFYCDEFEVAKKLNDKLLAEKKYRPHEKERLERNAEYFNKAYDAKLAKEGIVTTSKVESKTLSDANFVRTNIDNKQNRIAIIITNYNMTERADTLVEYLKNNTKWPIDIILVDNGSDKVPPSKWTSLYLGKNVQTTHGWLMGLNYCDSLEIMENFKYFAYTFIITSSEIAGSQGDIISQLAKLLIDYPDVVGTHPALSTDSTTWWKHMIVRENEKGGRLTNMIDNIFSMYRADWFNSIGRFEKSLTYAWGIDMETSYLARKAGKKLAILDDVQVKKVSNIGYQMDRMNMKAEDRHKNATNQINQYFAKKYGDDYNNIIMGSNRVEEFTRLKPSLLSIISNFHEKEASHRLIIDYIYKNDGIRSDTKDIVRSGDNDEINIVEVGCTRELYTHFDSTAKLAKMAEVYGYNFTTIDVDPENLKGVVDRIKYDKFKAVNQKGEVWLQKNEKPIHAIYLDAFDSTTGPNHHSDSRKTKYQKYLKTEITNENCYRTHLELANALHPKLAVGGLVCINDVFNDSTDWNYKGKLAVPYLLSTNCYTIIERKYNGILLKKICNEMETASQVSILNGPLGVVNETVNEIVDKIVNDSKKKHEYKHEYTVTLMSYQTEKPSKHTNWYPWNRFRDVFIHLGYNVEWIGMKELSGRSSKDKKRIIITWNEPTCLELYRSGFIRKDDIILQKLTSLGKGMEGVNWGDNPNEFYKTWHWPIYQTVEKLYDLGFNIYAFGCKTKSDQYPEKDRIVKKLTEAGRLFWINWGSTMYNYNEIMNCKPVMSDFKYDIGFVGSKWGVNGRGNVDRWSDFIQPLVDQYPNSNALYGSGFPSGQIDDEKAKVILKSSKICPILHAPSWVAEEGVQDRFYSVFISGRFGVCDNAGVYDFFDQDEVVVELDPQKYIEKSKYFIEHPELQLPYIEKVQKKIKEKYNLYIEWDEILNKVIDNTASSWKDDDYNYLNKISLLFGFDKHWIENK